MNSTWACPASWKDQASLTLLGAETLYICRPKNSALAGLDERLSMGEPPEKVLTESTTAIPVTGIGQLTKNPVTKQITVAHVSDDKGHSSTEFVCCDDQQLADAWAALKLRLGRDWQERTERQSKWLAAETPCKTLLLLVGMPLIMLAAGATGGQASIKSFGELLFFLVAIAIIVLMFVGANYLGVGPVVVIVAGLLAIWCLWLAARIKSRPEVVQLVREGVSESQSR